MKTEAKRGRPPRANRATIKDHKITFRVPLDMHQRLSEAAEREEIDLGMWVRLACRKALERQQRRERDREGRR